METDKETYYNSIEIYRQVFRAMLKFRREGRISNSSTPHAIVLIEELLRHAKKSVDIYCRHLGPDVWCVDAIVEALQCVCNKGRAIRVVVQEDVDESNRAVQLLRARGVEIRKDVTVSDNLPSYNFVIVDKEAFRFEQDCERRVGFACAINEEISSKLISLFDLIYSAAVTIATLQSTK